MAINKIVYGGNTLIDLTGDTAVQASVLSGATFHDKSGSQKTGTCTYDSDTSADTVGVAEILSGKTAHARGTAMTGTMPNIGKQTGAISTKTGTVAISQGYHDGSGAIGINATEQAKIVPENIAEGIIILGVTGTHKAGAEEVKQTKTVTPKQTAQTYTPDTGYTCISEFTVNAIPYTETDNSAGGKTVTIG